MKDEIFFFIFIDTLAIGSLRVEGQIKKPNTRDEIVIYLV
jgi:hypothetical protein